MTRMIIPESFYEFCLDLGGEFMEKMIPVRETKIKGRKSLKIIFP